MLQGIGITDPRKSTRCLAASEDLIRRLECKYTDSQYEVSSLAFHKRGKILALAGDEGYISLWALDHFPPKLMSEICVDEISIKKVDFVTGTDNQLVVLYDPGKLMKFHFNESGDPTIIDLNLDFGDEDEDLEMFAPTQEHCLIACSPSSIFQVDTRDPHVQVIKKTQHYITELAVHDNLVAVATVDSYARIYDTRMTRSPFTKLRPDVIGDSDTVETLKFSVHGELLVSFYHKDMYLFYKDDHYSSGQMVSYLMQRMNLQPSSICFYGPNCDYVCRLWDSGEINFWRKGESEPIAEVVSKSGFNSLVCHPFLPMLAGFSDKSTELMTCAPQYW
ncbi:Unknown protein [Striga hermonthica]|uniref:Uncharacterized protein n=1 Tax=Striga hermonthica TaxID=68872 RepID=A0A9N7NHD5_STRHE|nr:Unknown protein [Striga hermonthica]